jgi:hypothetical protein
MSHRAELISAVLLEYMIVGIDQFKPAFVGFKLYFLGFDGSDASNLASPHLCDMSG